MSWSDLLDLVCYVAFIICVWESVRKIFVPRPSTSKAASALARHGATLRRAKTKADRDDLHSALAKVCGKSWGRGS